MKGRRESRSVRACVRRDTNVDLITCKWLLKFLIRAGQNAAVQYTRHWYTVMTYRRRKEMWSDVVQSDG